MTCCRCDIAAAESAFDGGVARTAVRASSMAESIVCQSSGRRLDGGLGVVPGHLEVLDAGAPRGQVALFGDLRATSSTITANDVEVTQRRGGVGSRRGRAGVDALPGAGTAVPRPRSGWPGAR